MIQLLNLDRSNKDHGNVCIEPTHSETMVMESMEPKRLRDQGD
jgi:hypothetical protein